MAASNAGVMGLVVNLKRMQQEQLQKIIKRNKLSPKSLKAPVDDENLFSRMAAAEFCPVISSSILEESLVFVPSPDESHSKPMRLHSQKKAVKKARSKAGSWDLVEHLTEKTAMLPKVFLNPGSADGSPELKAVAPFEQGKVKETDVQEEQRGQVEDFPITPPPDPMLSEPDFSFKLITPTCPASPSLELEEASLTQKRSDFSQVNKKDPESPEADLQLQTETPTSKRKAKVPLTGDSKEDPSSETIRIRTEVSSCPKIASIIDSSAHSGILPGNSGSESSVQNGSATSTLQAVQATLYPYSAQQLVPSSTGVPVPVTQPVQQLVELPAAAQAKPVLSALPALGCFTQFAKSNFNFWNAVHCRFCGFPKSSPEELEAHIAWDHWNWVPFQCCYCEGVFRPTQYTLRLHLQEVHPNQPHKIICDIDDQKAMSLREEVQSAVKRMIQHQIEVSGVQKHPAQRIDTGILPVPSSSLVPPAAPLVPPPARLAACPASQQLLKESAIRSEKHLRVTPPDIQQAMQEAAILSQGQAQQVDDVLSRTVMQNSHENSRAGHISTSGNLIPPQFPTVPSEAGHSPTESRQENLKIRPSELNKAENGDIQCQECSAVMQPRQEHIHGHVYEHLHQKGLGYRYICFYCGYGSFRKFQFYAHSKEVHSPEPRKLKDRSQELAEPFYKMKSVCFPSYKPDSAGSGFIRCHLCTSAVPLSRKNEHIYRRHLKKPSAKCAHCDFLVNFGSSLKRHTALNHPGTSAKTESLIHLYKEDVQVLRAQCFGDHSAVGQYHGDQIMDQSSPTSDDSNELMPGPTDSIYPSLGADQLMTFSSTENLASMEVECGFGNGYAKVDQVIEAEEDDVVIIR